MIRPIEVCKIIGDDCGTRRLMEIIEEVQKDAWNAAIDAAAEALRNDEQLLTLKKAMK